MAGRMTNTYYMHIHMHEIYAGYVFFNPVLHNASQLVATAQNTFLLLPFR